MVANLAKRLLRLSFLRRLLRVTLSRHVRDLQIIALFGSIAVVIVFAVLTYRLSYQAADLTQLDQTLDDYWATLACAERLPSTVIPAERKQSISRARDDLAGVRGKIDDIDSTRFEHIREPLDELTKITDTLSDELLSYSFIRKISQGKWSCLNLSLWNAQVAPEKINVLLDHLGAQEASARRLASALSWKEGSLFSLPSLLGPSLVGFSAGLFTFLAWFYRTGDSRLSSVDMIAGEIHSLCRAMTNNQTADGMVKLYFVETEQLNIERLKYVEIHEEYNQVMTNIGASLGFLDQTTITRIMGFHTSLKMLRDQFRGIKNWAADHDRRSKSLIFSHSQKTAIDAEDHAYLNDQIKHVLFVFFLLLENARISLHLLLENGDFYENALSICLLSELRIYSFLHRLSGHSAYTEKRLGDRLGAPHLLDDPLESYFHTAYKKALPRALSGCYELYGPEVGAEIDAMLGEAEVALNPPKPGSRPHMGPDASSHS
jgi:hypothetical protein